MRRRAASTITVTVLTVLLLAAGMTPTATIWVQGRQLPDLVALGAQAMLAVSALLLWTSPGHRRAGVLLTLGVLGVGASHLAAPTFETWGYAGMVGTALHWSSIGFLLPVLLTFPGRRLDTLGRALVVGVWLALVLVRVAGVLTWDPAWWGYDGPARWWTVPGVDSPGLHETLRRVEHASLVVLATGCLVAFVRRWRSARGLARIPARELAATGIVLSVAVPLNGLSGIPSERLSTIGYLTQNVLLLVLPLGLLVVIGRSVMDQGRLVERLTARSGDAPGVQRTLADELADPDLRVWFRQPLTWLDVDGGEVPAATGPGDSPPYAAAQGRHWEILRSGAGRPGDSDAGVLATDILAAVDLADEALSDPGRVRVALGAATLVLDNTRLAVEREAHLAQLQAAQARIVTATLAERRRLEQDLHDGAQQQLLRVSATLSRARLATDPDAARVVVEEASGQLSDALTELRSLAHGIHPAVLSQGGLATALEQLARVDPRVRLDLDPALRDGYRPEAAIESAAYFILAESVANAVKHSRASVIRVSAHRQDDPPGLRLVVADDGVGGASFAGRGLVGVRDRVAALGGSLELDSPPGDGTRVDVWLPA